MEHLEEQLDNSASKTESVEASVQKAEKKSKRKLIADMCYFGLCFVYMIVMWATGWNFFAPFAAALAFITAVLIFIRVLKNDGVPLFLWIAYLTVIVGTLIFFLGYSAESAGKRIWWNLVLTLAPIVLAIVAKIVKGDKKTVKITTACLSILMAGTAVIYLFFMNLRLTPTVESLQKGHDEYLNSLNASKAKSNSPNVLFILMDDMAYSDISCYSYLGSENATINTPNIDSIADGGIFMENFYASAPVCTPSRFSALTGRYAARGYLDNVIFPTTVESNPYSITHFVNPYQFLHNVDGLLGDEITIAEALDKMGYDTSCIGKWNLGDYGEYLPTNQGFDYFYGSYYVNDMTPYNWVEEVGGNATEVRSHKDNLDQSESTQVFTEKIIDKINESVDNDNKFFMYYTSPWPHWPLYSNNNGGGKYDISDDTYVDCIEEFDRYLGQILQTLKDRGVYDDTLIVFTSDNGPGREGVTGSMRGRKNTTFEGGMKVPMLASYPNGGLGGGSAIADYSFNIYNEDGTVRNATTKRIESSTILNDIFPTVLSYVMGDNYSLPTDRIIDGVNLVDLWSGELASDERVHDVIYYMKRGKVQGIQMAVDTPNGTFDFKFYDNVHSENSAFFDQFYKNYLFNLDTDPAEGYNITKNHPEIAELLNNKLVEFRNELKDNRRGIVRR